MQVINKTKHKLCVHSKEFLVPEGNFIFFFSLSCRLRLFKLCFCLMRTSNQSERFLSMLIKGRNKTRIFQGHEASVEDQIKLLP